MKKLFWFTLGFVTASIGCAVAWYITSEPELVDSDLGEIDEDEDFDFVDPGLDDDTDDGEDADGGDDTVEFGNEEDEFEG